MKKVEVFEKSTIKFHPNEARLWFITKGQEAIELTFAKRFYFDLVLAIAIRQQSNNNKPISASVMQKIVDTLGKKVSKLATGRRRDYGLLKESLEPRTVEKYWGSYFRNQGSRKFTIIVSRKPKSLSEEEVSKMLDNLFVLWSSRKSAEYSLGPPYSYPTIILPDNVFQDEKITVCDTASYVGTERISWAVLVVDTDTGMIEKDIQAGFLNERLELPVEIDRERNKLIKEREQALAENQEYPWPGPTFAPYAFTEQRASISEHPSIHFILTPTDYFTFLAVQHFMNWPIATDDSCSPQTLRKTYLSSYNIFKPIRLLSQSISATMLILCKENGKDFALLAKRSSRDMLRTGRDVYVLSVNETPKRRPTEKERQSLENVPPERLVPDEDEEGKPSFFSALIRGTREEVGIDIDRDTIKILSLGLETERYQYALIGLAETNLTTTYIRQALTVAQDTRLEYERLFFVPFTVESIYDFMVAHRPWGPEAEIGLFQALVYKFGSASVARIFETYPAPRIA